MPIPILCEPLLKQIALTLEKQEFLDHQNLASLSQGGGLQVNTSDFELFKVIAQHPKLPVDSAIELLKIVSKIAKADIIFTRVSLNLLLTVLSRFQSNARVLAYMQELIKELFILIVD